MAGQTDRLVIPHVGSLYICCFPEGWLAEQTDVQGRLRCTLGFQHSRDYIRLGNILVFETGLSRVGKIVDA